MAALSEEEKQIIRLRGAVDPAWWLRTFLPKWYPGRQPAVHLGTIAILTRRVSFLESYPEEMKWCMENFLWSENHKDPESPTHPIFYLNGDGRLCLDVTKYSLIMLPRGFSKTTLINGANLYKIVHKERKFIVYISEAAHHAEEQLTNIRTELESNSLIHEIYGTFQPEFRSPLRWSQDMIQTTTGVSLVARGRGGQIRGLNINAQRPDEIVLDDVEDEESVSTSEQRRKTRSWFFKSVLPALPEMDPSATITAIGTLLGAEALLNVLRGDPQWTSIAFGALAQDGSPIWPELMGLEKLEVLKDSFTRSGNLNGYYLEYFNTLRNDESAKFKESYLVHEVPPPRSSLMVAMALDPAISDKRGADYAAIVVVGIAPNGLIWVLDVWAEVGATPQRKIDEYFRLWWKWKPDKSGIESIAYQAALVHLVREEMFRRSTKQQMMYHEIIPITHSRTEGNKVERVEGILQPRFAANFIRLAGRWPLLESQLLDWPNGKRDVPDAMAMAVALLDPFAPSAANQDFDPTADEYPEMDEWRSA